MLSEGEIVINKVAQSKLTLEDGLQWFKNSDPTEHRSILVWLRLYLEQSHPDQQLIDDSLEKVPLNSTMTPIVLFKTHPYKTAAVAVCDLPDNELEKSFITLLTLISNAPTQNDERFFVKMNDTHEWHNLDNSNLTKQNGLLARIKRYFG